MDGTQMRRNQTTTQEEATLGELFTQLSQDTSTLVRGELALAKAEMTQKASKAGKNAAYVAAGALIGYAGFLVLLGAVTLLLAQVIALWLAALIVGVIVIAIGAVMAMTTLERLKEVQLAPKRTIETLKEDREWLKDQIS